MPTEITETGSLRSNRVESQRNIAPEWIPFFQVNLRNQGEMACIDKEVHNDHECNLGCVLGAKFDLNQLGFTRSRKRFFGINDSWNKILIWINEQGFTCYEGV